MSEIYGSHILSTNTHILSPPWAAVATVLIPFKTCNKAADTLMQWFSSPEELKTIVGGSRWWQVRGLDGLEAEWVTEKSFLDYDGVQDQAKKVNKDGQKLKDTEKEILAMDGLERVMVSISILASLPTTIYSAPVAIHSRRGILLGIY